MKIRRVKRKDSARKREGRWDLNRRFAVCLLGLLMLLSCIEPLKALAETNPFEAEDFKVEGACLLGLNETGEEKLVAGGHLQIDLPGISEIGEGAFQGLSIKELTVKGIEVIGAFAFQGTGLEQVHLKHPVTIVGDQAFQGNAIESLEGDITQEVGQGAFKDNELTEVSLSVKLLGESAFENNQLTQVTLSQIETVGAGALKGNPDLSAIHLSQEVEEDVLGASLFEGISGQIISVYHEGRSYKSLDPSLYLVNPIELLVRPVDQEGRALGELLSSGQMVEEADKPYKVEAPQLEGYQPLEAWAEGEVNPINHIYGLMAGLSKAPSGAMQPMSNDWVATDFTLSGKVLTGLSASGIAKHTAGNRVLNLPVKNPSTGENITEIKQFALQSYDFNGALSAPHLQVINGMAFYRSHFTSIELPQVTIMGREAFSSSVLEGTLVLPQATEVGYRAFYKSKFSNFNLPKVEKIGYEAFKDSQAEGVLSLPQVKTIDHRAFENCQFEGLDLPLVQEIKENAFYSSPLSGQLNLPEVTLIGSRAFNASSFTSLNADKLTSLADLAICNSDIKIRGVIFEAEGDQVDFTKSPNKALVEAEGPPVNAALIYDYVNGKGFRTFVFDRSQDFLETLQNPVAGTTVYIRNNDQNEDGLPDVVSDDRMTVNPLQEIRIRHQNNQGEKLIEDQIVKISSLDQAYMINPSYIPGYKLPDQLSVPVKSRTKADLSELVVISYQAIDQASHSDLYALGVSTTPNDASGGSMLIDNTLFTTAVNFSVSATNLEVPNPILYINLPASVNPESVSYAPFKGDGVDQVVFHGTTRQIEIRMKNLSGATAFEFSFQFRLGPGIAAHGCPVKVGATLVTNDVQEEIIRAWGDEIRPLYGYAPILTISNSVYLEEGHVIQWTPGSEGVPYLKSGDFIAHYNYRATTIAMDIDEITIRHRMPTDYRFFNEETQKIERRKPEFRQEENPDWRPEYNGAGEINYLFTTVKVPQLSYGQGQFSDNNLRTNTRYRYGSKTATFDDFPTLILRYPKAIEQKTAQAPNNNGIYNRADMTYTTKNGNCQTLPEVTYKYIYTSIQLDKDLGTFSKGSRIFFQHHEIYESQEIDWSLTFTRNSWDIPESGPEPETYVFTDHFSNNYLVYSSVMPRAKAEVVTYNDPQERNESTKLVVYQVLGDEKLVFDPATRGLIKSLTITYKDQRLAAGQTLTAKVSTLIKRMEDVPLQTGIYNYASVIKLDEEGGVNAISPCLIADVFACRWIAEYACP